jgi:hypothetical protein
MSKPLLDAREQFAVGPPTDTEFPTPQIVDVRLPSFNVITRRVHSEIGRTCSILVDIIKEG